MIKRRYFRQDHGDKSGSSSSSSSSSSSNSDTEHAEEAVANEEVEEELEDEAEQEVGAGESGEDEELEPHVQEERSGYQTEESSGNDVDGTSVDDDECIGRGHDEHHEISSVRKASSGNVESSKSAANIDDAVEADFANCVLKCKSVCKCKLCPRIMCLNEDVVRVHLKSKRHARSKKLLGEGRLKLMLNSDGELEEEQETHAERHARTVALFQQVQATKKDSGRQRQNQRRKKRSQNHQEKKHETQNSDKKRHKTKEVGAP